MQSLFNSLLIALAITSAINMHALPDWQIIKEHTNPEAIAFAAGVGLTIGSVQALRSAQNNRDYIVATALLTGGSIGLAYFILTPPQSREELQVREPREEKLDRKSLVHALRQKKHFDTPIFE